MYQVNADQGKEETLTGHDGMREIDGLRIDAVGSETEDIGGKMCATDESQLSMVHDRSSVRIEQGNINRIIFIWVCALMVDMVTQRNCSLLARLSSMVQKTTLSCNGLRA